MTVITQFIHDVKSYQETGGDAHRKATYFDGSKQFILFDISPSDAQIILYHDSFFDDDILNCTFFQMAFFDLLSTEWQTNFT